MNGVICNGDISLPVIGEDHLIRVTRSVQAETFYTVTVSTVHQWKLKEDDTADVDFKQVHFIFKQDICFVFLTPSCDWERIFSTPVQKNVS